MKLFDKKGVVEVQFNWIFILIAGAIILLFFGYLVFQIKGTAEEKTSTTVLSNLEPILTGAGVSTGTLNIVKLPNAEIEVSCERFAIGSLRSAIESEVIFAPRKIKGREMLTWALEWAVPFRVTNFLYLTSPNIIYVFVYDSGNEDLKKALFEDNNEFPEEINKQIWSNNELEPQLSSIKELNNYEVRFIFLNTPKMEVASTFSEMDDKDVTALVIDADSPDGTGKLTFYQKKGSSWQETGETRFLRKPSLIGAIFSYSYEDYVCNMGKAFRRLVHVSDVYSKRSGQLTGAGSANCGGYHTDAQTALDQISTRASSGFPGELGRISDSITSLETLNKQAELGSCILIY